MLNLESAHRNSRSRLRAEGKAWPGDGIAPTVSDRGARRRIKLTERKIQTGSRGHGKQSHPGFDTEAFASLLRRMHKIAST